MKDTPVQRLFALQVIGILSALLFALNFCLEIFVLFSLGRNHQLLILFLQICLAAWAIAETLILRQQQPNLQLGWLSVLLGLQLVLEGARMALVVWGQPFGLAHSFGISIMDLGPIAILIPVYVLIFFAICKALMNIHGRELKEAWEKVTAAAVRDSKQQEREDLLRDMHDGFGSQLAGVRLLVEKGRIDSKQLPGYLHEISADLHLVVDTLVQNEVTLEDALYDMRYRTDRRFAGQDVAFEWLISLDGLPALSSRTVLQILRIVQEAIHNAIRHSEARTIRLSASYDRTSDQLFVTVADDGVGISEAPRYGRGLSNMRYRAREIGASWTMAPSRPGTTIELRMEQLAASRRPATNAV